MTTIKLTGDDEAKVEVRGEPVHGLWRRWSTLMWVAGHGVAIGGGELWDETGRIGRTTQACIVSKRRAP